jgi:hypothetical protein
MVVAVRRWQACGNREDIIKFLEQSRHEVC